MTEPTLKLVVAWSDRRNLCSLVRDALTTFAPEVDVLPLGDDATVVYTAQSADALRDALRGRLEHGDNLLVSVFEVWSSHGAESDATWLLARGH